MKPVAFLFDFGSPNAYLAHKVIPGIEERTGLTFDYVPILLGGVFKATNNQSPGQAYASVKGKLEYERLEMDRFVARHSIRAFTFNPHFPVNTLALMRGAVAAQTIGISRGYNTAVFAAMWEQGRKMDDPAVIAEVLDAAGLPTPQLLVLIQDQAVKDRLVANTTGAVERGVFGSPSFFVGRELYFGKDRLDAVEAAALAAR